MKDNIEDYRREGFIDLDEYLSNNPEECIYPYLLDGYGHKNFWTKIRKEDKEKQVYVKPRDYDYLGNEYNVYAEMLYAELLNQVQLKTANMDIAHFDGYPTVISENVLGNFSEDKFIVSGEDILQSRCYNADENTNIEDLFDAVHEYCTFDYLSRDTEEQCIKDIQKVCIADIFTLSTSRLPSDFDFIAGVNEDGSEILELAPSCHNTYALGASFTKEDIIEMLEDEEKLEERIELCYSDTGVPEYKRQYEYPYWEDSLYYFIDEDEENLDFAEYCAKNMNIDKAIKNVEEKIDSKIPEEYKEFIRVAFDSRLRQICTSLDLDYYKIMDNKYYEYEMEER